MHKRRIMALARSGLCRLPSSQSEAMALRAGFLPMTPRSLATMTTARNVDLYRLPSRSMPTSSLLRLIGGSWPDQVLLGSRMIYGRRSQSNLPNLMESHAVDGASASTPPLGKPGIIPATDASEAHVDGRLFTDMKVSRAIQNAIADHAAFGYERMSPVQHAVLSKLPTLVTPIGFDQSQPLDLTVKKGKVAKVEPPPDDLLIRARTGSGKTVAYLITALEARRHYLDALLQLYRSQPTVSDAAARALVNERQEQVLGALVLVPNRRIAYQVATVAEMLAIRSQRQVQLWVTDGDWNRAREDLHAKKPDLMIATPARILNGGQPRLIKLLRNCPLVIYDEIDGMLDSGNLINLAKVRALLPDQVQSIMVSATLPKPAQELLGKTLRPGYQVVDTVEADMQVENAVIPQFVTVLPESADFWPHLFRLLAHDALLHPQGGKAIIFCPTVPLVRVVGCMLKLASHTLPWADKTHVYEIYSNPSKHFATDSSYDLFSRSQGAYSVLVASDLVHRGMDFQDVTRVIQIGIAASQDDYTHRIGRTARAGKTGRADTILLPWEIDFLHDQPFGEHKVEPVTVNELESQVLQLAKVQERNTESLLRQSKEKPLDQRHVKMQQHLTLRLGKIEQETRKACEALIGAGRSFDSTWHTKPFLSLIHYYKSKTGRLRRRYETIVKLIEDFCQTQLGAKGDLTEAMRDEERVLIGLQPLTDEERADRVQRSQEAAQEEGRTLEQRKARRKERKEAQVADARAVSRERHARNDTARIHGRGASLPRPTFEGFSAASSDGAASRAAPSKTDSVERRRSEKSNELEQRELARAIPGIHGRRAREKEKVARKALKRFGAH